MKRSLVVPHPADPGTPNKEIAVDIVVKRQAVKPKVVPKLTHRLEPIENKPMDLEAFRRNQVYMRNVERIAGKTWPEVAREFELEMDEERKARIAAQKAERDGKGGR